MGDPAKGPAWGEKISKGPELRIREGIDAEGVSGGFFLKNIVNLELETLFEATFLRWDALSEWLAQLASPPRPILTSILHESQYLVLDTVNSDGFY